MVWYKSCPRCSVGDMVLDEDGFKQCLHCGHVQYSVGKTSTFPDRLLDMVASDGARRAPAGPRRVEAPAV